MNQQTLLDAPPAKPPKSKCCQRSMEHVESIIWRCTKCNHGWKWKP